MTSISVVIPNRNDSAYLEACFDSIKKQTISFDQIIFVDDASEDDSVTKARLILDNVKDSTIIQSHECLGTMGALNLGLQHVTSDYVLFLSSNDFLSYGLVECVKLSIPKYENPGVWSAMVWAANEEGVCKYVYPSAVISLRERYFNPAQCVLNAMKLGNWFTGTTLIFRRECLQAIGGFDVEYRGLADLLAALTVSSTNGAVFCPQPLGVMRMHSAGYLWTTISDFNGLEKILNIIKVKGPKLSKTLFTNKFYDRLKHRFRYSAIQSIGVLESVKFHPNWAGRKYKFLHFVSSQIALDRRALMCASFVILRHFDIWVTIKYRVLNVLLLRVIKPKLWLSFKATSNNHGNLNATK